MEKKRSTDRAVQGRITVSRTHGVLMDEIGMGKWWWDGLLISADSPQEGEPCSLAAPH